MKKFHFLLLFVFLGSSQVIAQNVKIQMNTELGAIIVELYPDKAPVTCANFLKHIRNNKLVGANFYRTVRLDNQPNNEVKIEVIQGGLGFDSESPYPPIRHETTMETGLLHKNGTFSMARAAPGTATCEFFICIGDQPSLDFGGNRNPDGQGFAAFGQVIQGMDVVKKIQQQKDNQQMLLETIVIESIQLLE